MNLMSYVTPFLFIYLSLLIDFIPIINRFSTSVVKGALKAHAAWNLFFVARVIHSLNINEFNGILQTLARAERSHAGRFKKALDELKK